MAVKYYDWKCSDCRYRDDLDMTLEHFHNAFDHLANVDVNNYRIAYFDAQKDWGKFYPQWASVTKKIHERQEITKDLIKRHGQSFEDVKRGIMYSMSEKSGQMSVKTPAKAKDTSELRPLKRPSAHDDRERMEFHVEKLEEELKDLGLEELNRLEHSILKERSKLNNKAVREHDKSETKPGDSFEESLKTAHESLEEEARKLKDNEHKELENITAKDAELNNSSVKQRESLRESMSSGKVQHESQHSKHFSKTDSKAEHDESQEDWIVCEGRS